MIKKRCNKKKCIQRNSVWRCERGRSCISFSYFKWCMCDVLCAQNIHGVISFIFKCSRHSENSRFVSPLGAIISYNKTVRGDEKCAFAIAEYITTRNIPWHTKEIRRVAAHLLDGTLWSVKFYQTRSYTLLTSLVRLGTLCY